MTDVSALRSLEAWHQCERHRHHLKHAMQALATFLPVTPALIASMNDATVQDWDQSILRFAKLQDALGTRLYPSHLDYLQELYADRPMLDALLDKVMPVVEKVR